ncbi:MAG TPA: PAS domain S-box protein, partial [Balneolaceae bacterium]|nr:PAS domain S-box protein [Balneolaceae bacterium]
MKFSSEESFFDAQPMFVCDQSTLKILDVNNAAVSILGYPKKYFYKKRVVDLGTQKSLNELDASLKAHKGQIS